MNQQFKYNDFLLHFEWEINWVFAIITDSMRKKRKVIKQVRRKYKWWKIVGPYETVDRLIQHQSPIISNLLLHFLAIFMNENIKIKIFKFYYNT